MSIDDALRPDVRETLERYVESLKERERSARLRAATALREADHAVLALRAAKAVLDHLSATPTEMHGTYEFDFRGTVTSAVPASPALDAAECAGAQYASHLIFDANSTFPFERATAPSGTRAVIETIDQLLSEHPEGIRPRDLHALVSEKYGGVIPKHYVLNALSRYDKPRGWTKEGSGWDVRWRHPMHAQASRFATEEGTPAT